MHGVSRLHGIIRFGVFELDLDTRELQKHGLKVKLQDQPFQVLAMLLERPGHLVTREDLQKRLWPADTFVDFDQGLGTVIRKLREALGDSADNPRFVETLPRQGFRFIAPVTGPVDGHDVAEERPAAPLPQVSISSNGLKGRDFRKRKLRYRVAAGVAVVLVATLGYLWMRPPPPKVLGILQITKDGRPKSPSILTDGSRLYYQDERSLRQVSVDGGESAVINSSPTYAAHAGAVGLSPNGSELLVQTLDGSSLEGSLWIVSVLTGSSHPLGDIVASGMMGLSVAPSQSVAPFACGATWSPDGKMIAFARGSDLYVARSDATGSRKLFSAPGLPTWPRWSPDEKELRFTMVDPKTGSTSLWETSADGSNTHPLLPGWSNPPAECCGSWTPDGRYFLFTSARNGRSDLWVMREQGEGSRRSNPTQLTSGPMNFYGPVPSKDGRRLFAVGVQPRGDLLRYDAKSGQFVPYLSGVSATGLDFSRDGAWVCYTSHPEGALWKSRVDGSGSIQLTFPPMVAYLPRWSPDGKQIAFQGYSPARTWRTYLMSADGGSLRELMVGDTNVGWSADGKSLVVGTYSPFSDPTGSGAKEIRIMDLKTHKTTSLAGSGGLYSPRWSPDGRFVAAIRSGPETLWLCDLSSKKWTQLEEVPVNTPSWSHDSKYIYFDTEWRGAPGFYRVAISGHKLEMVASLKDFKGFNGWWTGLTPEDSPLVVRDIGTQEIYALDWEAP